MKIADTYACCLCAVVEELCRDLEGCCTSLPQEHFSSCQSINAFSITKESSCFPIRKPLWVMGGEVAIGYVPSLWEGVMETLTWVEGAGNQHIWGFFCCQAAFTFHTEKKHVLQGEAQQNYKLIRYVDNSR